MEEKEEKEGKKLGRPPKLGRPSIMEGRVTVAIQLDKQTNQLLRDRSEGNMSLYVRELLRHTSQTQWENVRYTARLKQEIEYFKKENLKYRKEGESGADELIFKEIVASYNSRRSQFTTARQPMSRGADLNWLKDRAKTLKMRPELVLSRIHEELGITQEQAYALPLLLERGNG